MPTIAEPVARVRGAELVAEGTALLGRRDVGIVAPPFLIGPASACTCTPSRVPS